MGVLAGSYLQTQWKGIGDRNFVAVTERVATRGTNRKIFEIASDVARGDRGARLLFSFHGPLLDGVINDLQVLDASYHSDAFPRLYIVGNGDAGQNADQGHHNHDFNKSETPASRVYVISA